MHIYLVGGYVRDLYLSRELGYPPGAGDRDWVVVGATPEQMLQMGFQPVGKDFPVFLHPKTHEEYALARTEKKVAPGYHGFTFHASPEVTLTEDLQRRDLTINAMALDDDPLIDPYGGLGDLRAKKLRHVSEAFKEDPVRILRIARFSAKLTEFSIAEETQKLLHEMVQNGEADSLVPERVFLEMRKTLCEKSPSRFVDVLRSCGFWKRFFNDLAVDQNVLRLLDSNTDLDEPEKFALLTHGENDLALLKLFISKLKPPAEIVDSIYLWNKLKNNFMITEAENLLKTIEACDAVRRPERLTHVLNVARAVYKIQITPWQKALQCVKAIDYSKIVTACTDKTKIGDAIHLARLNAIKESV